MAQVPLLRAILGNLDYLEAPKYDDAIKALQINQLKIADKFNSHISISKDWMAQHSTVL